MISETTTFLFEVVIVLLLGKLLLRRWKLHSIYQLSKKLENSLRAFPFIGHAYLALGTTEDLMNVIKKFSNEAIKSRDGITGAWIGMDFYVVVADANTAGIIMKTALDKSLVDGLKDHFGNASIFAPVEIWRFRRKVVSPVFSDVRLQAFAKTLAQQSRIAVDRLLLKGDECTIPIWDPVAKCVLASICECAIGLKLDTIEHQPLLKAFANLSGLVFKRVSKPWYRFDLIKSRTSYKELEKSKNIIWNCINEVIQKNQDSKEEGNRAPSNFMEILMESSSRRHQPYNKEELREELVILILAAMDTTSVTVGLVSLMMALHPTCQERVYKEIGEVLSDDTAPTARHLSSLTYLDAVIRETLRLYPPLPVISRIVHSDIDLPTSVTIAKGCRVFLSIWGIQRNPRYWGDDAEQFKPERFLGSKINNNSAFMAFSYGPRNCVGQRLGMISTKMILASIVRTFRICPPEGGHLRHPLTVKYEFLLKHSGDYGVQLKRRMCL